MLHKSILRIYVGLLKHNVCIGGQTFNHFNLSTLVYCGANIKNNLVIRTNLFTHLRQEFNLNHYGKKNHLYSKFKIKNGQTETGFFFDFPQILYRMFKSNNFKRFGIKIMAFFGPTMVIQKPTESSLVKNDINNILIESTDTKKENAKKPKSKLQRLFIKLYEWCRLILRSARLFITFLPVFIFYPITYFGRKPNEYWWSFFLFGKYIYLLSFKS